MKKFLKRLVAGMLIVSCICGLAGCTVYTKNDLVNYTKKRLEEEYGEKFEIKTVLNGKDTVAYPVNNPELLFETHYVVSNKGGGFNKYLEEIVGQQFKKLVEEKFVDFKYKYYVDVDLGLSPVLAETDGVDTSITIEEFDRLTATIPSNRPKYSLFLSCEALNYSDEELYQLIEAIASTHNCFIDICFVTDEYFYKLTENFSKYSTIESDLYRELQSKFGSIGASTLENGKWKKDLDEFKERMKEVRNNELYR